MNQYVTLTDDYSWMSVRKSSPFRRSSLLNRAKRTRRNFQKMNVANCCDETGKLPFALKLLLVLLASVISVQALMMGLFGMITDDPAKEVNGLVEAEDDLIGSPIETDDGGMIIHNPNAHAQAHSGHVQEIMGGNITGISTTNKDSNAKLRVFDSSNRNQSVNAKGDSDQNDSEDGDSTEQSPWMKPKKFSDLFSSPNGVIYSNPFDFPQCRDALIESMHLNKDEIIQKYFSDYQYASKNDNKVKIVLPNGTITSAGIFPEKKPRNLPPTLWTRESIQAMIDPNRHELYIHCGLRATFNPIKEYYDWKNRKQARVSTPSNRTRTIYIVIGKCGSSTTALQIESLRTRQKRPFGHAGLHLNWRHDHDHVEIESDCTFTFVRDPISRLVSAYYTINFFMWKMGMRYREGNLNAAGHFQRIKEKWKWWLTEGEPKRFRTFCEEMMSSSNQFVDWHPLEHVVTITANISPYWTSKFHFIGKVERYNEHWQALSEFGDCSKDIIYNGEPIRRAMVMEGTQSSNPKRWQLDPKYVRWLSLDTWNGTSDSKYELPAWRAIREDQEFFNRLVEHFWQDYVCFGYEPNYPKLDLFYTGEWKKPGD